MITPTRREVLAAGVASAVAVPAMGGARAAPVDIVAGDRARLIGGRAIGPGRVTVGAAAEPGVTIVTLADTGGAAIPADGEIGVAFDAVPTLVQGIQLWRYAPWKAWTRPLAVAAPADLREDDVQLLYWRERDGSFMAAVPLSGGGFRTTLGRHDGRFAARAAALAAAPAPAKLPILAVGHGPDAHGVIAATYRAALAAMGRSRSAGTAKRLPAPLAYLGWNSWNASDLGNKLDAGLMLAAAKELRAAGVPIGWMLIDDGYFDHREQRLRGFAPDPAKFPGGFAPMVERLKREHGIRHVGAWLALDGYWHGIDPASPLGRDYAADLFTWTERTNVTDPASPQRTNAFVRPDRPAMRRYYDRHLASLRAAGLDFVKVDNQLVVERMARGNFPVWTLAEAMHDGLNAAAATHFGDAVINCMDLTADAYLNLGTTTVARAVEDYFPYKPGETYDLEKGNAAAHVLQAVHNALYIGQVAIPDFDMFESTNPNARLHAVARAANNGPVYVTDMPGHHDAALLRAMTLADGRSLRADAPLLPCTDCLFQLQAARPFKAFSRVGKAGLLAIFNLADAEQVRGDFSATDVPGFGGRTVIAYEHLSGRIQRLAPGTRAAISLPRFGAQLWSLHDAAAGTAAFGRSDKINGVAAIAGVDRATRRTSIDLHELGPAAAWTRLRPRRVLVDGAQAGFTWANGLLRIDAPATGRPGTIVIETR